MSEGGIVDRARFTTRIDGLPGEGIVMKRGQFGTSDYSNGCNHSVSSSRCCCPDCDADKDTNALR